MGKGESRVRAHMVVSGRVQGVFYRAGTQEVAARHGVKGWVKNRPDGRVEAVLQGNRERVEEVIKWCRKGPPSAAVSDIEICWQEPADEFAGFTIKY